LKAARAAVPQMRAASWEKNPIDAFILRRLAKEGLHPSPELTSVPLFDG